ncbi:septum formation initiator protein [Roseomonas frigidaquae]|uniref:Septum formation initiator protein n=1 Tax=Falsiroseomonas frigidaquae TaxID=487318 RepID=A0ABX1F4N1_9PROT|nr:septum formation initiator family protein [Falsiroseomonas frigidaquae]NKE47315.1 septum formation initiator protein [Falsiroseomonas frigidaquae]
MYLPPQRRGGFGAWISRKLRAAVLPVLFLGTSGYFVWHAVHGERGLIARDIRQERLQEARAELAQVQQELEAVERRVAGLRGDRLDRDQLDERARQLLNMVDKNELVVPYESNRRLF